MNRRAFLSLSLTGVMVGSFSKNALAITWFPQEFTCPNCKTKNTFQVVGSYGSYIYGDLSKYQLIYWPLTDDNVVYCCKKCFLSVFMWDFDELPKEKLPEMQKQLQGVKIEGNFKNYYDIPMSRRLEVAEKIYAVLGKEDDFWCRFNRTKGYHYEAEKNPAKADEARTKALELANKMLQDPKNKEPQKELFFIVAAMKHFLRDDDGAIAELQKVLATKFSDPQLDAEKNANGERNLNVLAKEYIDKIKSPQKPRVRKG